MKNILKKIAIAAILLFSSFAVLAPVDTYAKQICIDGDSGDCIDISDSGEGAPKKGSEGIKVWIAKAAETLFVVTGIASVIVIIWAGIMYSTAAGDAGKVARAKQIIVFAVIGLIISILAGAILAFVVNGIVGK